MIINYSDEKIKTGKKAIFLAGPTPREEGVKSWRKEACDILKENGFDGIVYVCEYSSWKPRGNYDDQAQWERKALCNSSVIVFWIPRSMPDMPAFTTNVEFGYWIHTGKILYGRPENAIKMKYLDWLYKKDTKKDPYTSLKDLLIEAIRLSNKRGIVKNNKVLPLNKRSIMQ